MRKALLLGLLGFSFIGHCQNLKEETLYFANGSDQLEGTLFTPTGVKKCPVLLFVHGDGMIDKMFGGYYKPLIDSLASLGIGSFTWDKPGVGNSTGQWMNQTMDARANEVVAAIELLKKTKGVDKKSLGLWGISQAGWVMPKAFAKADKDIQFIMMFSCPVEGEEQSLFLIQNMLANANGSAEEITAAKKFTSNMIKKIRDKTSYEDFQKFFKKKAPAIVKSKLGVIPEERYNFLVKNEAFPDVTPELKKVNCPVLALWGSDDVQVDPNYSFKVYKKVLGKKSKQNRLSKIDGTGHLLTIGDTSVIQPEVFKVIRTWCKTIKLY